jgi:Zn-dependent M16 (insulinase) family peptidase
MESDGGDVFSTTMIADFLYGRLDGSQMEEALDEIKLYNTLRTWSNTQWTNLIQKYVHLSVASILLDNRCLCRYFIDPKRVVVRGKPSAAVAERLKKEEMARIAKQKEALGPEGLAEKAKELEEAKAEHERPIPPEILKSFPVPSVKSISWIPVQSVQQAGIGRRDGTPGVENDVSRHVNADGSPLPFFVQYDHVTVSAFSCFLPLTGYKLTSVVRICQR